MQTHQEFDRRTSQNSRLMMTFLCAAAMVCVQLPEARSQTCGAPMTVKLLAERHFKHLPRLTLLATCCEAQHTHTRYTF